MKILQIKWGKVIRFAYENVSALDELMELIVNTFYNNRSIDLDNFAYGMKAVQDALVDREIIIDDNATTVIPLNRYRKCVKTERRVVIKVYNISGYEKVSIFGDSDFLLEL